MNREVVESWVDALESGKFSQGKNTLRDNQDRYCCLGVLCELAVEAGVMEPPISDDFGYYVYGRYSMAGQLPQEVIKWAGFDTANPRLEYPYVHESGSVVIRYSDCVYENDANDKTFGEIAALIRDNYLADS